MSIGDRRALLEAALAGEPLERLPVALWRHFPVDDQRAESLAAATLHFQRTWDFDVVKISPSSNYCVADWGVVTRWEGNQEGTRTYISRRVRTPEEYEHIERLDVRRGMLGEMVRAAELIVKALPEETPCVMTVFSPLTVVRYLRGDEFVVDLRRFPDAVLHALEVITRVYEDFVASVLDVGCAGIFLAVQPATHRLLSEDEYRRFGEPFDRRLLAVAERGWLNVLHAHGHDIMWELLAAYPVQAINWHDRHTFPSLAEARSRFGGALIGGLRQWETLLRGTPEAVRAEVADAREQVEGRSLIVGAGCVIPVTTPWGNLRAAVEAARGT
ncbi:MAG: uroporphyrinogen decarboxylase family protein [Ardenticatenia bacterium]|nr:uroporphyrinogen decarboxylase family protein [Ardenticatenia bacterium]